MHPKSQTIQNICAALLAGDKNQAVALAQREYPFESPSFADRKYKEFESTQIFLRDGFIDRYTGNQLVFPAVLRLFSRLLPEEFPFHPNWKMSESHMMYWELFPTVDHIIPVARGGADDAANWVTTSMLRNSAKSNWTFAELGWVLLPPVDFAQCDGLMNWLLAYIQQDPLPLKDAYIKRWYNAAVRALRAVTREVMRKVARLSP